MDRTVPAGTRINGYLARVFARLSRRTALLVVAVLASGILWLVAIAPAAVAFALAVGLGVGWCAWLEGHPEPPVVPDRSTPDRLLPVTPIVLIAVRCRMTSTSANVGKHGLRLVSRRTLCCSRSDWCRWVLRRSSR